MGCRISLWKLEFFLEVNDMAITKINPQNSLTSRLAFGSHLDPLASENHIDIIERGIGFNCYYDEDHDTWLSCDPIINYVIQFEDSGNKELSISWSKGNPYSTEINFSPRILFVADGTVKVFAQEKTVVNYTSNSNLSVTQSGYTITNTGTTTDITVTLPQATTNTIGVNYYFHALAGTPLVTYRLRVRSYPGDYIHDLDILGHYKVEVNSNTVGSSIRLVCVNVGLWEVGRIYGDWAWL